MGNFRLNTIQFAVESAIIIVETTHTVYLVPPMGCPMGFFILGGSK